MNQLALQFDPPPARKPLFEEARMQAEDDHARGRVALSLAAALANYDGFDSDNDPHGERDFGDLILWGYDCLFKIDYLDKAMEFGSDDPANPEVTTRVLTLMLATEW